MKNLCEIGKEIAVEFGYSEDEVCRMTEPEYLQGEFEVRFKSLFDEPEFILAQQRAEEICMILSTPRIAETMPINAFDEFRISCLTEHSELSGLIVQRFHEAVEHNPTRISVGFERLMLKFLEECIKLGLNHDVAQITRICIAWKLSDIPGNHGVDILFLGLIHTSRGFDIFNDDEKCTIGVCVDKLLMNIGIIRELETIQGFEKVLYRWRLIQCEIRALN
jgi:hypothetical protein